MASLAPVAEVARKAGRRLDVVAWALQAIFVVAIALRVWAASYPSIHHPDETFQYLEAAHRIVFGYGIVPWEYKWGIRNWLFPLLLSGPMALGGMIAPGSDLYLTLPKAMMIAISLVIPWTGWRLGNRISPTHGLMAAFVCAIWSEFAYFAPHALSENLAIALTLAAAVSLSEADSDQHGSRWRLVLAGILMGLATLVRFQFAPVLAVFAAYHCRTDLVRWGRLISGGLVAGAIGGLVDIGTGSIPFAWLMENIFQNVLQGRAAQYGVLGSLGYISWFEQMWSWALILVAPLAYVGMKRQPALFWAGVANIAAHTLIAHKEYRFVEFSAVAFVIVASIGSIDAVDLIRRRFNVRSGTFLITALCIAWLAASFWVFRTWPMDVNLSRARDGLTATAMIAEDRTTCGVGIVNDGVNWGGYVALHRPVAVSIFDPKDTALQSKPLRFAIDRWASTFNKAVVSETDGELLPAAFSKVGCTGADADHRRCVYSRAGGCAQAASSPFRAQLIFDRIDAQIRDLIAKRVPPTP